MNKWIVHPSNDGFQHTEEIDSRGRVVRQNLVKFEKGKQTGKLVSAWLFRYKGDSHVFFEMTTLGPDSKTTSVTHYVGEKPAQIDEVENGKTVRHRFPEYAGERLLRTRIVRLGPDGTAINEEVWEEPEPLPALQQTKEGQLGLRLPETDPTKDGVRRAREIVAENSGRLSRYEEARLRKEDEAANNQPLMEQPSLPEKSF
jgi:hypothetical protein